MSRRPSSTTTADEKARVAAYARAYYRKVQADPDLGLRAEVSAVKAAVKRVARRIASTTISPLHPADAVVAADTDRTLTNDAELLSVLVHPSRRVAR